MAYDSIDMAADVCNTLESAGLARFDLAGDDESTGNQRAFAAVEKALADRAALLAALKLASALTYEGADCIHKMTMKEKARFLASSLVAIATVAAPVIAQAEANQPHTVARPDDPMRDHNERLEFAAAQETDK